jgi:hypothetical protein
VSSFVRSTAHDKRYALSNDYQSHGTLVLDINIIYLEMDKVSTADAIDVEVGKMG